MEMLVGFDQSIQDFPISNDVAYINLRCKKTRCHLFTAGSE
jgi:hypothetical protein